MTSQFPVVLTPFSAMPKFTAKKTLTILIVGSPGVGKKSLGTALTNYISPYACEILTTGCGPLVEKLDRPRVDFVVFLISMRSMQSLTDVLVSLDNYIDVDYWFGRSCIVASHAELPVTYSIRPEDIYSSANQLELPAFFTDLTSVDKTEQLASYIINQAAIAAHYVPCVSPALLRALETAEQTIDSPTTTSIIDEIG